MLNYRFDKTTPLPDDRISRKIAAFVATRIDSQTFIQPAY